MTNKTQHSTKQSKWFCIAVAGEAIDGRKIEQKWLQDMADTYNPKTYGARIWIEHFRGLHPDSSFGAYGDVLALKIDETEINGEKRKALFAQIEALQSLIDLNKKGQKIYTSIEVGENFAATGKAYLIGLGITDTPASLGTDRLNFSSKFAGIKFGESPENLFSTALETVIEFEEGKTNSGWFDKFKAMFTANQQQNDGNFSNVQEAVQMVGERQVEIEQSFSDLEAKNTQLSNDLGNLQTEFNTLKTKLESNEPPVRKTFSAGVTDDVVDC